MQEQNPSILYVPTGLDNAIKVFMLIKVMLQTAFWGLMLGATIWLLVANPLPKLMTAMQNQVLDGMMGAEPQP